MLSALIILAPAWPVPVVAVTTAATQLRGVTGKPCLDYRSITRREIVIDNTFDHVVAVENSCPKAIDVKICYRGDTASCRDLKLSPYGKTSTILGVMYNVPTFAFDYDEKFAN